MPSSSTQVALIAALVGALYCHLQVTSFVTCSRALMFSFPLFFTAWFRRLSPHTPDCPPTPCRLDAGRTPALQLTNVTIMLTPVELQVRYWIHRSIYPNIQICAQWRDAR